MILKNPPQPIPYQGSKRRQVPIILQYIPPDTRTLWEPFVGSGATTIGAGLTSAADSYVVGDTLHPLVAIWRMILEEPLLLCDEYEAIWCGQHEDPRSYYDHIRDRFNREPRPAQLLYLIARCVKNAVRFNSAGEFNQSPDNRRLGMTPSLLRFRVSAVHQALRGRTTARCEDYSVALREAEVSDVVYMDPPYMGVSGKKDPRYHQGLDYERFVHELDQANQREVSFLVSFDGRCGSRTYGPGLPSRLELTKIEVHLGRSSQATLNGRSDETVESLYLSRALVGRLDAKSACIPASHRVRTAPPDNQLEMFPT